MSSSCVPTFSSLRDCDTLGLTYGPGNQVLQRQYEKEQELGHITSQTKFNYAWGLVKSPNKEQQVEGVGLLQGMFPTHFVVPCRSIQVLVLVLSLE